MSLDKIERLGVERATAKVIMSQLIGAQLVANVQTNTKVYDDTVADIELALFRIRINAVAPAVVETPVYNTFMTEEQVKATLPSLGAILPVDGGVTAGRQQAKPIANGVCGFEPFLLSMESDEKESAP